MTYKIHHGLSSAYLSSFIHYHTLSTQYTPDHLLAHALSYPGAFAHAVFLPGPPYLNVMFCQTNPTNSSDILWAITHFLCEAFLDLPNVSQCLYYVLQQYSVLFLIWRVTTQYNNGPCLIWILFQIMTLAYLRKDWFYLIHHYTSYVRHRDWSIVDT